MERNANRDDQRPQVVVFTRDLRVSDNVTFVAAANKGPVVPLFVNDDSLLGGRNLGSNRRGFLHESLIDLDASLRRLGGGLIVRRGDWVGEVLRVVTATSAAGVHVADDVSGYAQRRLQRLTARASALRVEVSRHPGITVIPPAQLSTKAGGYFKVFSPYHRAWLAADRRAPLRPPRDVRFAWGDAPEPDVASSLGHIFKDSPGAARGGERVGLKLLDQFLDKALDGYDAGHDALADDRTSRLSAYLHFGCVSPLVVAEQALERPGGEPFVRQLVWREFYAQLLAAQPELAYADFRSRNDRWSSDADLFAAWCEGRTGYPIVDAGMRQLVQEGFMHNRARLVTASFLTKDLYIDWRVGAAHFMRWLTDGDVANNQLNWQWVAGTGTDTNPFRIFNPVLQGQRYDSAGVYIRRYVTELASIDGDAIHWPSPDQRERVGYPQPIVDHREAIARFRQARSA